MDGMELICFQIISSVGSAKSMYIGAIQEAKAGNFKEAKEMMEEGQNVFNQGHVAHSKLIQAEANGEKNAIDLLLMHAEDQLMAAETVKIMANELIDLYSQLLTKGE